MTYGGRHGSYAIIPTAAWRRVAAHATLLPYHSWALVLRSLLRLDACLASQLTV